MYLEWRTRPCRSFKRDTPCPRVEAFWVRCSPRFWLALCFIPARAGGKHITAAITKRFIVYLSLKLKRSLRDNESGGTATPLMPEEAVEVVVEAAEAAEEAAE